MIENLVAQTHSMSAVLIWCKVKDTVGTSRDFHCDTGKRLNLFLLYDLVFGFYLFIWHLSLSISLLDLQCSGNFAVVTRYSKTSGAYDTNIYFLFALHNCWRLAVTWDHIACTWDPGMCVQLLSQTFLVLMGERKRI